MNGVVVGNVMDVLPTLPAEHFHCVVTSPPYWNLRDYGIDAQLGLEPTPDAYVENMVAVFREVRRVLHPTGTLWLNMGDSYASTGGHASGEDEGSARSGRANNADRLKAKCVVPSGLKPKDLCGMPWRLAFALRADGWYLRSAIVWAKGTSVARREGAVMPESVTDRPTSAYEMVFLLTKNKTYFYDAEAVKEAGHTDAGVGWAARKAAGAIGGCMNRGSNQQHGVGVSHDLGSGNGGNLRNVWRINTAPYSEAHFATYPPKLVEQCLKAGTSEKGCCPECGTSWERVVEMTDEYRDLLDSGKAWTTEDGKPDEYTNRHPKGHPSNVPTKNRTTGWRPGCECLHPDYDESEAVPHDPVPCRVLDPFGGSGTTGMVAAQMMLDYTLVELNPEYAQMARDRIGQAMKPGTYASQDIPTDSTLFAEASDD